MNRIDYGAIFAISVALAACRGNVMLGESGTSSGCSGTSCVRVGDAGMAQAPDDASAFIDAQPMQADAVVDAQPMQVDAQPMQVDAQPAQADDGSCVVGSNAASGGYVDAGYYYGADSFWVDGGAYPELADAASQGTADAASGDASAGCGALSACCVTLTGTTQALCNTVSGTGDATNCGTALAQLESAGDCTGVTVLASQVQVPASRMVSDGTLLFWSTFEASPGLFAMPVGGGPITTLLSAETANASGGSFLAVDDVNVYVLEGDSLVRVPKNGAPATLVNEEGAMVVNATLLGGTAYWLETQFLAPQENQFELKSAPLLGGCVTTTASSVSLAPALDMIAVTSTTGFVGLEAAQLFDFPLAGVPASGPTQLSVGSGYPCGSITSDTDAIYCAEGTGSNFRIASDGSITTLGPADSTSYMVYDDTYVYWVDNTTVGTIMKAPKAGGGTATVIAQDTNPTAIAVDANSVYWSDTGGYIKSIAK